MKVSLNKVNWLLCLGLLGSACTVWGQEPPPPNPSAAPSGNKSSSTFPLLQEQTINNIIDITARQVSRRYDLTPEQAKVARDMLEKNSWGYINKNFDKLSQLVPQMYEMRMSKDDPSAAQVQQFATQFAPLLKEATDLILSENEKFHNILDDRQKKIHQEDMDKMRADIGGMSNRMQRWARGEYQPGEFRYGLMGQRPPAQPAQVGTPTAGGPDAYDKTLISYWELYVKMFIEALQLDEGQRTMAYSVLARIKSQGQTYHKEHDRELIDAKRELQKLELAKTNTTQPVDEKTLTELRDRVDALNKPLLDLFQELVTTLNKIPTQEQWAKVGDVLGDQGGAERPTTQPAKAEGAATTQPAAQ